MADDPIDLERLIDEIDDEVLRRRTEGELDPDWERQLDELFSPGAPAAVGDFSRLIDAAEHAARVDATPPSESQRRGGEVAKRALGRAMSWYVSSVTRQVTTLGTDLVMALRALGERVTRLEQTVDPDESPQRASLLDPHLDLDPWTRTITEALRSTTGRVVHGDAGNGSVVGALLERGVDAYGVEPRLALAERASIRNLDVREESVAEHLAALAPASLGGLVLSGCIDTMPNGLREPLVRRAQRAIAPGGVLALIASDPQQWGTGDTRVVADLAPGRPWHVTTWSHVLVNRGFDANPLASGATAGAHAVVAVRRSS